MRSMKEKEKEFTFYVCINKCKIFPTCCLFFLMLMNADKAQRELTKLTSVTSMTIFSTTDNYKKSLLFIEIGKKKYLVVML
jgi:hypothetical protein